jgi:hypothetical protein
VQVRGSLVQTVSLEGMDLTHSLMFAKALGPASVIPTFTMK